mmetsp:Transcript_53875/g.136058  ORF Transcript_53875/g.136058 Transcript_53875/m.136058 type:complete len:160 (+) Transcript_53875:50-529(+)
MPSGTMKRWNSDKGFGFIQPSDGGDDVFCHVSALLDGEGSVFEGDKVSFAIEYDDRKGKDRAAKVSVSGGGGGGGGRGRDRSRSRGRAGGDGGGCSRSFGGGGGGGDVRAGDWECPDCGANVFASKSSCFKCGAPKPRGGGGRGGRDERDDRDYDRRRR